MDKILCILQARMGSTRLPGKVLMEINNKPLLEYQVNRIKESKLIDKIVIATSIDTEDDKIDIFSRKIGIDCFRGDNTNLLKRINNCALKFREYNTIVRITGDCPLIDPVIIDNTIKAYLNGVNIIYGSNIEPATFPDGLDVEIVPSEYIFESYKKATKKAELESPLTYIRTHYKNNMSNYAGSIDYSKYRLTVDEKEDFELINILIKDVGELNRFEDYIKYIDENNLYGINSMYNRNDGTKKLFADL